MTASGDARGPVAVEAVGHAMREPDARHRFAGDVACVEDEKVAALGGLVVAEGQHPAFAPRAGVAWDEARLADAVPVAERARLGSVALEIVLADGRPEGEAAVVLRRLAD